MRIWDVSPGYLNRQSLLGEHRELHGLHAILREGKPGYSRHPETLRWAGALTGLAWRHGQLVAEMQLRRYVDRTPLRRSRRAAVWPRTFVTEPWEQFLLLRRKYAHVAGGRIRLPRSAQELWAQHKYSVMARSPALYRTLGRRIAGMSAREPARDVARELVLILHECPDRARVINAVEHMWGHIRRHAAAGDRAAVRNSPLAMLMRIQTLAEVQHEPYLLSSTALSELTLFL